jgi:hypothetical protein
MNPIGVSKLRYLEQSEFRSVGVEDFTAEIQKLHNHIKENMQNIRREYKHRVD